jgi:hypothetical protein
MFEPRSERIDDLKNTWSLAPSKTPARALVHGTLFVVPVARLDCPECTVARAASATVCAQHFRVAVERIKRRFGEMTRRTNARAINHETKHRPLYRLQ